MTQPNGHYSSEVLITTIKKDNKMSNNKTPQAAITTEASYVDETIRQLEEVNTDPTPESEAAFQAAKEGFNLPLIINRIKKNNETGGYDITLALDNAQVYTLLNFAIMFLASQGLAQFADQEAQKTPDDGEQKEEVVLGSQIH